MIETIRKVHDLLNSRERSRALLLLVMITAMGLLETLGVASIMPFMAVLGDPEVIERSRYLSAAYGYLGFTDPSRFLFFLGGVVFAALILGLAFKALTTWMILRFAHMRSHSLSYRLFQGYLERPYVWFLRQHSADLGKTLLAEVTQVVNGTLIPGMQVAAQSAVMLFLLILLIVVAPFLAIMVGIVLGGAYGAIYLVIRRRLSRAGQDRVRANQERYRITQEAFGGIKDVKVLGLEASFGRSFLDPSHRFAIHQADSQIIAQLPRYILEAVGFGGILLVVLYLLATRGSLGQALPFIALYAFAGYRLLPAVQQIYYNLALLRFGRPALDLLHREVTELSGNLSSPSNPEDEIPAIRLNRVLELDDVLFAYPGAGRRVLDGLTLRISANSTSGLVGSTGSGKTTAVDLILGLLEPTKGVLRVDGIPITCDNLHHWKRNLGYVPQHIFLTDDTIAANIAFGLPREAIDMQAVEQAARVANLHRFVTEELGEGYGTLVGERGIRLSGGQRQRIGIARALYHDPDVLILDEATSALDNLTERAVMEAVHNLGHRKTIILIAHRLTTVRECDTIHLLEEGRVVASGTYDELLRTNNRFRAMAEAHG